MNQEGRKSMLKLAERMVISFYSGVGASTAHSWTTLSRSGAVDIRVMPPKGMDDQNRPPGTVLSATGSFWIHVPPKRVFDFFRNENSRNEWDILSNGVLFQEMVRTTDCREQGNCVSLFRVNGGKLSQSNMLTLQESFTGCIGSYVIYAPINVVEMNIVLNGGDLPSGIAILPDGPSLGGGILDVGSGGSLITVGFQILFDSAPTSELSLRSIATIKSLIKRTI